MRRRFLSMILGALAVSSFADEFEHRRFGPREGIRKLRRKFRRRTGAAPGTGVMPVYRSLKAIRRARYGR